LICLFILSVGACDFQVLCLSFCYFTIYKQSLLKPGFYGSGKDHDYGRGFVGSK